MSQIISLNLKTLTTIFLFALLSISSCGSSDNSESSEFPPQSADFNSDTLPGTYHITFEGEEGTHTYLFYNNGTVLINYFDGTEDIENWLVNSSGQLSFSGSISDLFTLTDGDQFSGVMNVKLLDSGTDDEDEEPFYTVGTIKKQ